MKEKIINVSYEEEMSQSYLDYSMSVIVSRALPDIRDGLKPVHRRIMFSAEELACRSNTPHKKSARIVGDILGKYHPHGDASVYDAMVRLAQPFNMRYPLIDGHGNFGSIDGDSAAAMRYTEARLSKISNLFLEDLKYDIVPMKKNFDNTLNEPVVLPVKIPSLLINGTYGIAVGMMANILPHNLGEVIDTVIYKIDNPNASIDDMLEILKGPDFPTKGIICSKSTLPEIYKTGKGSVTVRSRYNIEHLRGGKKQIVITEIPYSMAGDKENVVGKIIDLANNKKELNITNVRDESSKEGIRIVIELKKDISDKKVMDYLFKHTKLQDNITVSMLGILNNRPLLFNLEEYINIYLDYQRELYVKKYNKILAEGELKVERLQGLLFGKSHLKQIYEITTKAPGKTEEEAESNMKKALMHGDISVYKDISASDKKIISTFRCTDVQAEVILETKLRKLSNINTIKIQEQCDKVTKDNDTIRSILASERKIKNEIKKMLKDIKKNFADERKTEITDINYTYVKVKKEYNVFMDENNYIKTTKIEQEEPGLLNERLSEDDRLIAITNLGECIVIKPSDLMEGDNKFKGIAIENYLPQKLQLMHLFVKGKKEGKVLYITKEGYCKLVDYKDLSVSRTTKAYLPEENELILVEEVNEEDTLIYKTKRGKNKKINLFRELKVYSKTAKGKKVFNARDDLNSIEIVHENIPDDCQQLTLL